MENEIELKQAIGKRIRELLKERGIKQSQLALAVGVSGNAISKILKGESFPELDNLESIAQTLNVSMTYLITGDVSTLNKLYDELLLLDDSKREFALTMLEDFKNFQFT